MNLESLLKARPSRREELPTWYSQLLDEAEREGASVPELAERLGCSRETVYAWRRRFAKEANGDTRPVTDLVRVRVVEPPVEPGADRLEVRTRGGRSVLVPSHFDPSALAAVVAVLERC